MDLLALFAALALDRLSGKKDNIKQTKVEKLNTEIEEIVVTPLISGET